MVHSFKSVEIVFLLCVLVIVCLVMKEFYRMSLISMIRIPSMFKRENFPSVEISFCINHPECDDFSASINHSE